MNLEELQAVRETERSKNSLQTLRESFYEEAAAFVQELREERRRAAAEADDPFDDPAIRRLSDEIATAEQTIEAIYERRVGKLVKQASFAAAGMPTDDEGLTREEQALYADLVEHIESNRRRVLASIADDDDPAREVGEGTPPGVDRDEAGAAGGDDRNGPEEGANVREADRDPPGSTPERVDGGATDGSAARQGTTTASDGSTESVGTADGSAVASGDERVEEAEGHRSTGNGEPADAGVPRTTVKITADVGEIVGIDERTYDLVRDDVVTLPEANARPLLEHGAASRLE